ncbi:MAG: DUF1611 domain-containing protein [Nitrososphaerota archaeon]|nr:DUF1611 domain-containing protein [Nitrososphaerota archaeon]
MQSIALASTDILSEEIKWSWACRNIWKNDFKLATGSNNEIPSSGDLALLKVESIGYHDTIVSSGNSKIRIYPGDLIVGVFGNRYATDAYEGLITGTNNLSLLTAGGMVGTVVSKHKDIEKPTSLSFIGYIMDGIGQRINTKKLKFRTEVPIDRPEKLIVVVGTGMNTGKTTVSRKLVRSLSEQGFKVAACKLTGSVSNRDQDELRSAGAKFVADFSDYGFPSTYLSSKNELIDLFNTMMSDVQKSEPDIVVMEIADGVIQRETTMILEDPSFRRMVNKIVLAAESSLSGLHAVNLIKALGYSVACVSGKMTSSPLYVKEFQSISAVPVISSADQSRSLARVVDGLFSNRFPIENNLETNEASPERGSESSSSVEIVS